MGLGGGGAWFIKGGYMEKRKKEEGGFACRGAAVRPAAYGILPPSLSSSFMSLKRGGRTLAGRIALLLKLRAGPFLRFPPLFLQALPKEEGGEKCHTAQVFLRVSLKVKILVCYYINYSLIIYYLNSKTMSMFF